MDLTRDKHLLCLWAKERFNSYDLSHGVALREGNRAKCDIVTAERLQNKAKINLVLRGRGRPPARPAHRDAAIGTASMPTQVHADTSPCGHQSMWTQVHAGTSPCGHQSICSPVHVGGPMSLWTHVHVDSSTCGHNSMWTQVHVDTSSCGN